MPPKRGKRLDREQLEEVSAELIDAITAEPLHPTKFVEVVSPDGKLRLFYNTSTLIRIGMEKGMFMQPPHFREPMTRELLSKMEELEGRTITLTTVRTRGADSTSGSEIVHRHVHFDQIVEEFYHLSPTQVIICPACYQRWLAANPQWRHPVDPLDALSEVDEAMLPMFVFRFAKDFKWHVENHHWMTDDANENRFRDVLCHFMNEHNARTAQRDRGGMDLTLHRYWLINARYNVVRYNRIVGLVSAAPTLRPELLKRCAFPESDTDRDAKVSVAPTKRGTSKTKHESEPFVVDDDDGEEWIPSYALGEEEEEEEVEAEELSESTDLSSSSSDSDDSSDESSSSCESTDEDSSQAKPARQGKKSAFLAPHPEADRLNFNQRQYVQKELEKLRRQDARDMGISSVRRPRTEKLKEELEQVPEDLDDLDAFLNGGTRCPVDHSPSHESTHVEGASSAKRMLVDDDGDDMETDAPIAKQHRPDPIIRRILADDDAE